MVRFLCPKRFHHEFLKVKGIILYDNISNYYVVTRKTISPGDWQSTINLNIQTVSAMSSIHYTVRCSPTYVSVDNMRFSISQAQGIKLWCSLSIFTAYITGCLSLTTLYKHNMCCCVVIIPLNPMDPHPKDMIHHMFGYGQSVVKYPLLYG